MALSGVTTYQLTGSQIINAALRKLAVLSKGQVADADDLSIGLEALNLLLPSYQTHGMQLWKRTDLLVPLVSGQDTYILAQPIKPATIDQAYLEDINSGGRVPIEVISHFNYTRLPNTSSGMPVQITYQPLNTTGVIKVWPKPDNSAVLNKNLYIISEEEIQVLTDVAQTIDFPREWQLAVVYGLAVLLAPEFSIPLADRQKLEQESEKILQRTLENTGENASLYLQPDMMYNDGNWR